RLPERVAGAVPEGGGASGAGRRPLRGGGRARTHHPLGARVPRQASERMTLMASHPAAATEPALLNIAAHLPLLADPRPDHAAVIHPHAGAAVTVRQPT